MVLVVGLMHSVHTPFMHYILHAVDVPGLVVTCGVLSSDHGVRGLDMVSRISNP